MTQQQRKDEHIYWAEKFYHEKENSLEGIRFIHQGLPKIDVEGVDIQTHLFDKVQAAPFYINAMTGGTTKAKDINQQLAWVAKRANIALALGSASIVTREEETLSSFLIAKEELQEGTFIGNIGLEYEPSMIEDVANRLEVDAMQVHINVAQELFMPEGNRTFSSWKKHLSMLSTLPFPVIIKEVGFGMSGETFTELIENNIQYVDLSGRGGTNFAQIEIARSNHRTENLATWGQTTAESLLEAQPFLNDLQIFASGGIQSPLDVVKCMALGAQSVGVAGYFLHFLLEHGKEKTLDEVLRWQEEIRLLYTLLNCKNHKELQYTNLFLSDHLQHWYNTRQIGQENFACRNKK
ncbi:type 2 isopentenyl-diphosphate Delta-isomerase [Catellicoccus marimammalium]|uniref:Isopentenyl-diphosphate delta-isomerase n=1 Tax=Catellicoccus marimammalium M35/04/3 TaxID=1234409 RepID=K8ZPY0_9ENTE|nr:type 2 isopentenyl-diphosphate Delta-isomerase [Catellicoccus marimammalium]EKU27621.1 Isopentenyl-diphosphate delta-isomerase, FMN-dependent [Catellicoccus marimammalium M35/04/3]